MAKSGLEGAFGISTAKEGNSWRNFWEAGKIRGSGSEHGIQENLEALLELIGGYLEEGYRRIKVKIKPGWDLQVLEKVRDHFPRFFNGR